MGGFTEPKGTGLGALLLGVHDEEGGLVYVGNFRNQRGATSVAAYSTRARAGAPVSMPITWEELDSVPAGNHFTIDTVGRRLAKRAADPWAGYEAVEQTLPTLRRRAT